MVARSIRRSSTSEQAAVVVEMLAHLREFPDYYARLEKMERRTERA
jgi:hypothetical protein